MIRFLLEHGANYYIENGTTDLLKYLSQFNTYTYLHFSIEEIKENTRWKPKIDENYWIVNLNGEVDDYVWNDDNIDNFIYDIGNCFKTEEETKQYLGNIKTGIELRKLAEKLNNGEKINWKNSSQWKYYLNYNYENEKIQRYCTDTIKNAKVIYCLNENFKEEAINLLGERKLEKYLKEF